MHPQIPASSRIRRRFSLMILIICAGAFLAGCKSESSVATDSPSTAQVSASPAASPVANPAGGAGLPPSAVPTSPVGPVGQTTPTAQGERQEMRGNLPVTVSSAKPALTPAPDPFPARPTPTVVMTDGKIVQQWQAPADAAKQVNPFQGKADAVALGRELYLQKCVDCHGKEGKGNGWMGQALKREGKPLLPTNLASKVVQANTDGELYWKITNGRSPMPSHRVRFEDDQRWQIVSFIRTFKE